MTSLIQFVGDPFVDAGGAVLEGRIEKPCEEFTRADLSRQADQLESIYTGKAWVGYLTVHFPNSCWCNATMSAASKGKQRTLLLRSFDSPQVGSKLCVYCGKPAQLIGDRSTVPLVTGAVSMTAGPGGEPGLPVCSGCQFAIQFYPLAALKVEGRPLFWWTPEHKWMYLLTLDFAGRVRKFIDGSPEQVPSIKWPATQLFKAIESVLEKSNDGLPIGDLVGCHATNYGSGPEYQEIRIVKGVVSFMQFGLGHPVYRAIRDRSWEAVARKVKKQAAPVSVEPLEGRRNFFYEEIGVYLRGGGGRPGVIRRHFRPHAGKIEGTFELACVFSRKVLRMTQEQVEAIKTIADQIATSGKASDHLGRLFQRKRRIEYIRTLADISDRMVRGEERAITLDTVLAAFDVTGEDDAFGRDAGVVWELLLLRLIERLPSDRLPELKIEEPEGEE